MSQPSSDPRARRRRRVPVLLVAILGVLLGAAGLTACQPPLPVARVFGDSLTFESRWAIWEQADAGHDVRIDAQGGSALCDWRPAISDAIRERPAVVVVQFSGNALTPCIRPGGTEPTSEQILARYRADAEAVVAEAGAAGVPVVLVGSPPRYVPPADGRSVDTVYREVAAASGGAASYVDAGAAVAGPSGEWTETLPCLPNEGRAQGCSGGQIAVRAQDRAHFCPVTWSPTEPAFSGCGRWSSGAWRFGGVIARSIPTALRGGQPLGSLDSVVGGPGSVDVAGWALDPDAGATPVDVHVYVGASGHALRADLSRVDVAAVHGLGASHGFSRRLPAAPGTHQVCAYAINVGRGDNLLLGCRSVVVGSADPLGSLDRVATAPGRVTVAGWALDPETGDAAIDVRVLVASTDQVVRADRSRPDVAAALGAGPRHGFSAALDAPEGPQLVCVVALNRGAGADRLLGCRTVTVPPVDATTTTTTTTVAPTSTTTTTVDPSTTTTTEAPSTTTTEVTPTTVDGGAG